MLPTELVPSVVPSKLTPRQVGAEFRRLLDDGAELRPMGGARHDPGLLLARRLPRHKLELFGNVFYLTDSRFDENLGFFVAYVLPPQGARRGRGARAIHPRIFYKDVSLVWRSATHCILSEEENWVGKGELKSMEIDGEIIDYGAEETTNLPIELQPALDIVSRLAARVVRDDHAVVLALRNAPDNRLAPYRDFTEPRRRAMAKKSNLIHGGASVAWFERAGDPTSLRFADGFEPDFDRGVLESNRLRSNLYGGTVIKFRILSRNRQIQYQFIAAPRHVWIMPAQALTTELSTYGVRTLDVEADDDLYVPGYEYHFVDEDGDHSQIPKGFAGASSKEDPSRADASAWLDALPVVQAFRSKIPLDF